MSEQIWKMKGSLSKMTAEQRQLLGALIGLARVCDTNEITKDTNSILVTALLSLKDTGEAKRTAESSTEKVHEEKFTISPGCRYCASPCGRTADFDLNEFRIYPQSAVELKEVLIDLIIDNLDVIKLSLLPGVDAYSFFVTLRYCLFVIGEDFTDGGVYDAIDQLKKALEELREKV